MPLYSVCIEMRGGFVFVSLNLHDEQEKIARGWDDVVVTVEAPDSERALERALFLLAQHYVKTEDAK